MKKKTCYENSFSKYHIETLNSLDLASDTIQPSAEPIPTIVLDEPKLKKVEFAVSKEEKEEKPRITFVEERTTQRDRSPMPRFTALDDNIGAATPKRDGSTRQLAAKVSEERLTMQKLYHKDFNDQLNSFTEVLKILITSERHYGKNLRELGVGSKGLFSKSDCDLFEDCYKENSVISPGAFTAEEQKIMEKKFGEKILKIQKIVLPEWKIIKNTFNTVGMNHFEYSNDLDKVINFFFVSIL